MSTRAAGQTIMLLRSTNLHPIPIHTSSLTDSLVTDPTSSCQTDLHVASTQRKKHDATSRQITIDRLRALFLNFVCVESHGRFRWWDQHGIICGDMEKREHSAYLLAKSQ
jgi:hypothetical protein